MLTKLGYIDGECDTINIAYIHGSYGINGGVHQNSRFTTENPIKHQMIWGYPLGQVSPECCGRRFSASSSLLSQQIAMGGVDRVTRNVTLW